MLLAILLATTSLDEDLQLDVELASGAVWARSICDAHTCANAFTGSLRVGFGSRFASLGARAAGVASSGGQQSRSLLADLRFNTLGTTQATFGFALGVGHLIQLQCNCDPRYAIHGEGMTVIEGAIGVRTFALSPVDGLLHLGLDLRIGSWAGGTASGTRSEGKSAAEAVGAIPFLSLLATVGASL